MQQPFRVVGFLALLVLALAGLPARPQAARASALPNQPSPAAPIWGLMDQGGFGGEVKQVVVETGRAYVAQASELKC